MNGTLPPDFPWLHDSESEPLRPGQLWSLWDMLRLDPKKFVTLIHFLISQEHSYRNTVGDLPEFAKIARNKWVEELCREFDELSLTVSSRVSYNMLNQVNTYKQYADFIRTVYATMASEIEGKTFYAPLPELEKYFQNEMLFGEDVFNKFPSAANDIFEAGTCLALDRSTACVMHCMKVAEVGLAALANALSVPRRNDWGSYLRDINNELNERMKTSGVRTANEQFFAEAHTVFDGMRRAWRNPTMHVENTYSSERAEEIMLSVKSFMRHLSAKISE